MTSLVKESAKGAVVSYFEPIIRVTRIMCRWVAGEWWRPYPSFTLVEGYKEPKTCWRIKHRGVDHCSVNDIFFIKENARAECTRRNYV